MATPALLLLQFRSIHHHLRMAHKLDKQDCGLSLSFLCDANWNED